MAMLDGEMLTVDQRRFFVETRGDVYFSIAGAIFGWCSVWLFSICRNGRGV